VSNPPFAEGVHMRLRSGKKREQIQVKPAHWAELGVSAGQTPVIRAERAGDVVAATRTAA
jgi:hypothetical protein